MPSCSLLRMFRSKGIIKCCTRIISSGLIFDLISALQRFRTESGFELEFFTRKIFRKTMSTMENNSRSLYGEVNGRFENVNFD